MTLKVAPQRMVPLEGETLEGLVALALLNIDQFDHARFEVWRLSREGAIAQLADRRPPDRLYRIITDNERAGKGAPLLVGIVVGYRSPTRGGPASCCVQVLGVKTGAGSYESPLTVPGEALEDITDKARSGKLRFG